ncbi:MAG: hypothetical protein AB1547_05915 [Thermodesulfobacteriota bacterium]
MKTGYWIFSLVLYSLLAGFTYGMAQEAVVLVPPFENQSGISQRIRYETATSGDQNNSRRYFSVDRYSEFPRSKLEHFLINKGITVAERRRIDQLLLESDFGHYSGLVDVKTALKLSRMVGANLIVMGTVLRLSKSEHEFKGYDIHTKSVTSFCELRVRVLNSEGIEVFSNLYEAQINKRYSPYYHEKNFDYGEVLNEAINEIDRDVRLFQFLRSYQGR